MSRLREGSSITARSRLARQASVDALRNSYQNPNALSHSKSSTRIGPLRNKRIDSPDSGDEMESPLSAPRFSLASSCSTQTNITTPRTSITPISPVHGKLKNSRIGQRVAVESLGLSGTLRYYGSTQFKDGIWAGIELHQPGAGKNDGSVNGVRYFDCPAKTGIFVLSSKITFLDTKKQPPQQKDRSPRPSIVTSRYARKGSEASVPDRRKASTPSKAHPEPPAALVAPVARETGIPSPEMTPTLVLGMTHPYDSSPSASSTGDRCLGCTNASRQYAERESSHRREMDLVNRQLAETTDHLSSKMEVIDNYRQKINSLEQTVDDLKRAGMESIELYEKEMQRHETEMKKQAAKLAGTHARITALEAERDTLATARDTERAERLALQDKFSAREEELQATIHTLKAKVDQEDTRQTEMEKQMETFKLAWQKNLAHMENQLVSAQEALAQERQEHETSTRSLQDKIASLEATIHSQQQTIQTHATQSGQDASVQERIRSLEAENLALRNRLKELPPHPVVPTLNSVPPTPDLMVLRRQLAESQQEAQRWRDQAAQQDKEHRRQINTLNCDISELESLIESKIFKEADLLEALETERRAVKRLLSRRRRPGRKLAGMSTASAPLATVTKEDYDLTEPFCEICNVAGHDLMSCTSLFEPPYSSVGNVFLKFDINDGII
ncbi:hypothetical protein BCR43DRAFT_527792 [Syncephalastrum racemosum]|uniref:CAP-Gly domain-containing protein n=1 Tax=Syncephalastrum racemosum TaxID=13706 RepID=A0A1X2H175_SYNRA|nr:hypothetical protein BCR43DRAFT_527792 [Syncephalastrum racemosum]